MKQITEDYVSFEIAKLLKEKGFDERGLCVYTVEEERFYTFGDWVENSCLLPNLISAPTHQMALKWLREVHKINIVIDVASDDDNLYSLWKFDIWNGNYSIIWGNKREKFNSYEQAVEAALLYVLKKLI